MAIGSFVLLVVMTVFVGSHLVLSHPLREPAIRTMGLANFQIVYALIAMTLLGISLLAFRLAPSGPTLWPADNLVLQLVFDGFSYFATALFLASLFGNPALVGANLNGLSTRMPDGVFRMTRHPMMFAVACWSVVQLMIMPSLRSLIASGALMVLALVGAHLQDRKKLALSGREWRQWASRTPFWPDLRQIGSLGLYWVYAVVPWLGMTWFDTRMTRTQVGVFFFLPNLPY